MTHPLSDGDIVNIIDLSLIVRTPLLDPYIETPFPFILSCIDNILLPIFSYFTLITEYKLYIIKPVEYKIHHLPFPNILCYYILKSDIDIYP
jgi:hypothetical protein